MDKHLVASCGCFSLRPNNVFNRLAGIWSNVCIDIEMTTTSRFSVATVNTLARWTNDVKVEIVVVVPHQGNLDIRRPSTFTLKSCSKFFERTGCCLTTFKSVFFLCCPDFCKTLFFSSCKFGLSCCFFCVTLCLSCCFSFCVCTGFLCSLFGFESIFLCLLFLFLLEAFLLFSKGSFLFFASAAFFFLFATSPLLIALPAAFKHLFLSLFMLLFGLFFGRGFFPERFLLHRFNQLLFLWNQRNAHSTREISTTTFGFDHHQLSLKLGACARETRALYRCSETISNHTLAHFKRCITTNENKPDPENKATTEDGQNQNGTCVHVLWKTYCVFYHLLPLFHGCMHAKH